MAHGSDSGKLRDSVSRRHTQPSVKHTTGNRLQEGSASPGPRAGAGARTASQEVG